MKRYLFALVAMLLMGLGNRSLAQSATELTLVKTLDLHGVKGRIDHMAIDPKTNRLYVAALGNDSVEVIDIKRGDWIASLSGIHTPQGVCVVPDTGMLIVASGADGNCTLYDKDQKVLATIDGLNDADNVRYDAAAKLVYVGYGHALAVIDPNKREKVGDIPLDGHPESFQLEAKGKRIFINLPSQGSIAIVDRDKREVTETWHVEGAKENYAMALADDDHRLLVACRQPAMLLVLNTHDGQLLSKATCTGDADDVFYNSAAKKVYVTGGEGEISVLERSDADSYQAAETVKTEDGARTSLWNPGDRQLYVAIPRRGGDRAEVRVYQETPKQARKLDLPAAVKPPVNIPSPGVPKPSLPNVPKSIPKPRIPIPH